MIECQAIGTVRSRFLDPVGMPIQTAAVPDEAARIELLPAFAPGLKDIEGFEFLILITHLHRVTQERLEVVPFLDDVAHGVFATRAPTRPNRLGLSVVRLERVEGTVLHFTGNDMLDGTPVLDIKPYVPRFDARETQRIGWFSRRIHAVAGVRADHRMG
jgi:tRNA-Thr(GGU) m(6)t(6)A37 methyltransferase TsaA